MLQEIADFDLIASLYDTYTDELELNKEEDNSGTLVAYDTSIKEETLPTKSYQLLTHPKNQEIKTHVSSLLNK